MFNLSGLRMPSLKINFILCCLHLLFLSLHSNRFHGIGEQRKQRNRILALTPFFAQLKHWKSHSSVFLCSPIPWKWLPCRLDVAARALFQAKDHDVIHRVGGVVLLKLSPTGNPQDSGFKNCSGAHGNAPVVSFQYLRYVCNIAATTRNVHS